MNGLTLVELIVAIAILGIGVTVGAISFAPLFDRAALNPIRESAVRAINGGVAVTTDSTESARRPVVYLPDGRAIGARDPLTGGLRVGR